MIDVTFLLLIYFIVTTVFTPPDDILSPALKVEEGTSSQELDLEPQGDPVRSWTIKDEHGRRILTNGLCIMQPHSILHIQKIG